MAKSKVKEAVKFFQKCLDEIGLHVSRLIIFGSQAKGTAHGDSDIDLLIGPDEGQVLNREFTAQMLANSPFNLRWKLRNTPRTN